MCISTYIQIYLESNMYICLIAYAFRLAVYVQELAGECGYVEWLSVATYWRNRAQSY